MFSLVPLFVKVHKERTIGYIQSGVEQGATLIRDGREDDVANSEGYFVGPTIFDQCDTGNENLAR